MTVLSRAADLLFQRKNRREVETRQSAFDVYRKALLDDISGRDVDIDALEEALPVLGKDEAAFREDVKTMATRIEKSKLLATERDNQQRLAKATEKRDELAAQLDAEVAKMRKLIDDERTKVQDAEFQLAEISTAKAWLLQTNFDPELQLQIAEASSRMGEHGKVIYENQTLHAELANKVDYIGRNIDDWKKRGRDESTTRDIERSTREMESARHERDRLGKLIDEARIGHKEAEADLARLNLEALKP